MTTGTAMGATEAVARFVAETEYEGIPARVLEHSKTLILDTFAIMVGGVREPCTQIASKYIEAIGGTGEALLVPTGKRSSAPNAAFLNGISAHALEMDESTAGGHTSCVTMPAILALGEARGKSGKEFLVAYALSFEMQNRLGLVANNALYRRGHHQVPNLGTLGATFGCAKVLGLDVERTRAALGLAATSSGGIRKSYGTMAKRLHAGNGARNGVMAAVLSELGYPGVNPSTLETRALGGIGNIGWFKAFCGEGNYDASILTRDLGAVWYTVPERTFLKFAPGATTPFVSVELALAMRKKHNIDLAQIERVDVAVSFDAAEAAGWLKEVKSGEQSRFDVRYAVAVSLLDGKAAIEQYIDARVRKEDIRSFREKVHLVKDPEVDAVLAAERKDPARAVVPLAGHFSKVTIRMKDGKVYNRKGDTCRGSFRNPASFDDIAQKLRDCAAYSGMDNRKGVALNRLVELVRNIGGVGKVGELTAALGG